MLAAPSMIIMYVVPATKSVIVGLKLKPFLLFVVATPGQVRDVSRDVTTHVTLPITHMTSHNHVSMLLNHLLYRVGNKNCPPTVGFKTVKVYYFGVVESKKSK